MSAHLRSRALKFLKLCKEIKTKFRTQAMKRSIMLMIEWQLKNIFEMPAAKNKIQLKPLSYWLVLK